MKQIQILQKETLQEQKAHNLLRKRRKLQRQNKLMNRQA